MADKVVIVHLRRPRLNDPNDSRRDPFWEFGSFGLTGCHSRNLMHYKKVRQLLGVRLAFVQGDDGVMKLVYITPPVFPKIHRNVIEACWTPSMPFKFDKAPLVINNSGETLFPGLKKTFSGVDRDTWVGKFSSRYRAASNQLADDVAGEVIAKFDHARISGRNRHLAINYEEALPFLPCRVDTNRLRTYQALLIKARL